MVSGDYADLNWLKRKLTIGDEDDDLELDDSVESANRYVDDILSRYAATLPLTGDVLVSATNVANADAMREYKLSKQDIDNSREWKATRNERSEALIGKLKTDPNTNTQSATVSVASTYRSEPLASRST